MRRAWAYHKNGQQDDAYCQKAGQLYLSEESKVPSRVPPFFDSLFEMQKRLRHF